MTLDNTNEWDLEANVTYFTSVYEFGQLFNSETEAIKFANNHDWSKEPISQSEHMASNFSLISTTEDGKTEIYYDHDWEAFFFTKAN